MQTLSEYKKTIEKLLREKEDALEQVSMKVTFLKEQLSELELDKIVTKIENQKLVNKEEANNYLRYLNDKYKYAYVDSYYHCSKDIQVSTQVLLKIEKIMEMYDKSGLNKRMTFNLIFEEDHIIFKFWCELTPEVENCNIFHLCGWIDILSNIITHTQVTNGDAITYNSLFLPTEYKSVNSNNRYYIPVDLFFQSIKKYYENCSNEVYY